MLNYEIWFKQRYGSKAHMLKIADKFICNIIENACHQYLSFSYPLVTFQLEIEQAQKLVQVDALETLCNTLYILYYSVILCYIL